MCRMVCAFIVRKPWKTGTLASQPICVGYACSRFIYGTFQYSYNKGANQTAFVAGKPQKTGTLEQTTMLRVSNKLRRFF